MSLGEKPATAEDELMKIGELAKAAHTQVETIRYYEREGLLPETARTDGNYRMYAEEHVDRLSFIRHCRGLDMTLDEIRVLLRFKDAPHGLCCTNPRADALTPTPDGLMPRHPPARSAPGRSDRSG